MRAVVYAGPEQVEVRSVPDAHIEAPEDALVRVTLSAICGTDLHAWHGLDGIPPGTPLGHEFVGEVVAVGSAVQHIAPGFTSFTLAPCRSSEPDGVRASRNSSPVCAKPMADFARSCIDGLSSLCV